MNVLTMQMSVHIDNQPFKVIYISSEVKSSEVYSHEVARGKLDVTLECYLLPITLSPGLGCLLGTYRIQI